MPRATGHGGRRPRTTAQQKSAPTVEELRAAFCEALTETANVSRACQISGLPRRTAYDAREADEAFRAAWDAALERGTDALEDEAVRRGREGAEKPVYQGGKLVGYVREYSDTLLIFMLKARRPEKFKDRVASTVEVVDARERNLALLDAVARRASGPAAGGAASGGA